MREILNNFKERINKLNQNFIVFKTYKEMYDRTYQELTQRLDTLEKEEAKQLETINKIQEIASSLNDDIIKDFENLINEGIREVFEENYSIKIVNKKYINKIVTDILVVLPDGKEVDIYEGEGGGLKDFVALLMRVLYFILMPQKRYPILFLDENLKHLDKERAIKAFHFIKTLTDRFNIQVLFITHLDIENSNANIVKIL